MRAAAEAKRRLQTNATNGPGWMLLALYEAKLGQSQNALSLIGKAESLGANDLARNFTKPELWNFSEDGRKRWPRWLPVFAEARLAYRSHLSLICNRFARISAIERWRSQEPRRPK